MAVGPLWRRHRADFNIQLRLDKGTSSSSSYSRMTMGSADGSIEQTYHIRWRTCDE